MSFREMFQSTEAEEFGEFALIDKGEYEAEITDVQLDLTKEPNRLIIEYTLTNDYKGRKQWGNYQLEGRGIGFLKKDLTTLGLDFSQVDSPEAIMELVGSEIGTQVLIYVNQKEYNGKIYNNPYLNERLSVPAPAPTNQKEADRRAKSKPETKSAPQKNAKGKTSAKKKGEGIPNFDDSDEIPF